MALYFQTLTKAQFQIARTMLPPVSVVEINGDLRVSGHASAAGWQSYLDGWREEYKMLLGEGVNFWVEQGAFHVLTDADGWAKYHTLRFMGLCKRIEDMEDEFNAA